MSYETIIAVKEEIKLLSAYQTKNKHFYRRYQSLYDRDRNAKRSKDKKYEAYISEQLEINQSQQDALSEQFGFADHPAITRARITALVNFYHEIRGSGYRHGTSRIDPWLYERAESAIKKQYCKKALSA